MDYELPFGRLLTEEEQVELDREEEQEEDGSLDDPAVMAALTGSHDCSEYDVECAVLAHEIDEMARANDCSAQEILCSHSTTDEEYGNDLKRYKYGKEILETKRLRFSERSCQVTNGAVNVRAGFIGTTQMWRVAWLENK